MKNSILLFGLLIGFFHLQAQETDTSEAPQELTIGENGFLQYYDDLYTTGFAWLVGDSLYIGKSEWSRAFATYLQYVDPSERAIPIDSLEDRSGNTFKILEVNREGKDNYYIFRAWKGGEPDGKIELELVLDKKSFQDTAYKKIRGMIKKWERYSNAHKPAKLLEKVYDPNAYYVNGGKVQRGWEAISQRYAYMESSNWKIDLITHRAVQLNPDQVLEIGTYKSGGEGKYILLWQKHPKLGWRAVLDFNF
ncbi:MAG: hypothetical protein AAFY71_14485 [Bacteroidota bacterium]